MCLNTVKTVCRCKSLPLLLDTFVYHVPVVVRFASVHCIAVYLLVRSKLSKYQKYPRTKTKTKKKNRWIEIRMLFVKMRDFFLKCVSKVFL